MRSAVPRRSIVCAKRNIQTSVNSTSPVVPSIEIFWPLCNCCVMPGSPATAGNLNSRATMAPCERMPPVSITRPAARAKRGTQAGSVDEQTRMNGWSGTSESVGAVSTSAAARADPTESGVPLRFVVFGPAIGRPIAFRSSLNSTGGTLIERASSRRCLLEFAIVSKSFTGVRLAISDGVR